MASPAVASGFIITEGALKNIPNTVLLCEVSFHDKSFLRFVRANVTTHFPILMDFLVDNELEYFVLRKPIRLKLANITVQL